MLKWRIDLMVKMRGLGNSIMMKMNLTELGFSRRISNKEMSFKMRTKESEPLFKKNLMIKRHIITIFYLKLRTKWLLIMKILEDN
jgi:hypothetical protein